MDNHARTIIHIDMDCFYAQVEMIRNPELRDKPLGVQQKYLMVTCNYVAREQGVRKMMGVQEAKKVCPELVLVSGENLTHYRNMSYKITEFLTKYTPIVERMGFDENFLDVSALVDMPPWCDLGHQTVPGHTYNSSDEQGDSLESSDDCQCGCHWRLMIGAHIAAEIRAELFREMGITCCGGIAHNKVLAKLVAGTHKPNQQTLLYPEQAHSLISQLKNVRHIPGIGWSTFKKLKDLGITSVADLLAFDSVKLSSAVGEAAASHIQNLCQGIDDTPVVTTKPPQSMSVEDSFRKCSSLPEAQAKIEELVESLLQRVIEDGRRPGTVRLTIRRVSHVDGQIRRQKETKQTSLPSQLVHNLSLENEEELRRKWTELLVKLFQKLVNIHQPFHLSLINVAVANFSSTATPGKSISSFFQVDHSQKNKQMSSEGQRSEVKGMEDIDTEDIDEDLRSMNSDDKIGSLDNFVSQTASSYQNPATGLNSGPVNHGVKIDAKSNSQLCSPLRPDKGRSKGKMPAARGILQWVKKTPIKETPPGGTASTTQSMKHTVSDKRKRKILSSEDEEAKGPHGAAAQNIDPEVLAALPEDIRKEVIAQYKLDVSSIRHPHTPENDKRSCDTLKRNSGPSQLSVQKTVDTAAFCENRILDRDVESPSTQFDTLHPENENIQEESIDESQKILNRCHSSSSVSESKANPQDSSSSAVSKAVTNESDGNLSLQEPSVRESVFENATRSGSSPYKLIKCDTETHKLNYQRRKRQKCMEGQTEDIVSLHTEDSVCGQNVIPSETNTSQINIPELQNESPINKRQTSTVEGQFNTEVSSLLKNSEFNEHIKPDTEHSVSLTRVSSSCSVSASPALLAHSKDEQSSAKTQVTHRPEKPYKGTASPVCHAKSQTGHLNNNEVPPGIDCKVFFELPLDVRQELVRDWKRTATPKNSIKKQKTTSILNFFKKT